MSCASPIMIVSVKMGVALGRRLVHELKGIKGVRVERMIFRCRSDDSVRSLQHFPEYIMAVHFA
jgi:hypothetical protein